MLEGSSSIPLTSTRVLSPLVLESLVIEALVFIPSLVSLIAFKPNLAISPIWLVVVSPLEVSTSVSLFSLLLLLLKVGSLFLTNWISMKGIDSGFPAFPVALEGEVAHLRAVSLAEIVPKRGFLVAISPWLIVVSTVRLALVTRPVHWGFHIRVASPAREMSARVVRVRPLAIAPVVTIPLRKRSVRIVLTFLSASFGFLLQPEHLEMALDFELLGKRVLALVHDFLYSVQELVLSEYL